MSKQLFLISLMLLELAGLVTACGGDTTNTPVASNQEQGTPDVISGTRTVKPFYTPSGLASPSPVGTYALVFDDKAGGMALEASVTTQTPPQSANSEWQVQITNDGIVKYIKNPRDKNRAVTEDRFLNPDKLKTLLSELNDLGVLDWPDTTPPRGQPALDRNLSLYLKGRPKLITDLSGATGDKLDKMLTAIKETVEAAPLRNSP